MTLKFKTYYNKIKNKQNMSDIDIFVNFCKLIGIKSEVNTWHIQQNNMKDKHNGKESIKDLCLSKYLEHFQATVF